MKRMWMLHGAFTVMLIGMAGCDTTPPLVPASGTINLDGKPLDGAVVRFVPVDGEGAWIAEGTTDSQGRVQLRYGGTKDGAPVGHYKVILSTERPDLEGAESLPLEFTAPETTPLLVTIEEGGSTFELEATTPKRTPRSNQPVGGA